MIVSLSDKVESDFRSAVKRRFGSKRGALSIAFEEAVKDWLSRRTEGSSRTGSAGQP